MPAILGIGTDIEEISRFYKHIHKDNSVSSLINELFTSEEVRLNLSHKNPYLCFTLGFSCKESVFKALGRSWMNAHIVWKEIECLFLKEPETKRHEIRLSGGALKLFEDAGGKKINGEYETHEDHVVFRIVMWK